MPEEKDPWRVWIACHGPVALLYARQLTASLQDAEDAVHEGFLRFWAHRDKARESAALFFVCVRSAALDGRRKAGRQRERDKRAAEDQALFAAPPRGVEDALAMREEVERRLAALARHQREVVVLKIWGGLTFSQIAVNLGESPNTVAGWYRQAMEKLAELFAPEMKHER